NRDARTPALRTSSRLSPEMDQTFAITPWRRATVSKLVIWGKNAASVALSNGARFCAESPSARLEDAGSKGRNLSNRETSRLCSGASSREAPSSRHRSKKAANPPTDVSDGDAVISSHSPIDA